MANLNDEAPAHEYLSLGSSLLTSFEQFILCLFIHMMSLVSTTIDWSTVMEANQEASRAVSEEKDYTCACMYIHYANEVALKYA